MAKTESSLQQNLIKVSSGYNQIVDQAKQEGKKTEKLYRRTYGHTLEQSVRQAFDDQMYFDHAANKLDPKKTTELMAYGLRSYARFRDGIQDPSTNVWRNPDKTYKEKVAQNAGYLLRRTDRVKESLATKEVRDSHIRQDTDFSKLKFGDVIQIYQPYTTPKAHAKNDLDAQGQNRYYGIIQPLKNGDYLAVDFRGHKYPRKDEMALDYNPEYAYPSSKNVHSTLNYSGHEIVQLSKDAIIRGSDLRERHEAASYGKPYQKEEKWNMRVLEMSPKNLEKMKIFKANINRGVKNIDYQNGKVTPETPLGRLMFNKTFYQESQQMLSDKIYDKREQLINDRLAEQQKIRVAKYGKGSTQRVITEDQKFFMEQERRENDERRRKEHVSGLNHPQSAEEAKANSAKVRAEARDERGR